MVDLGGARDAPPCPNFFLHFHAVFGTNWSNGNLAPCLGIGAPLVNPESVTGICIKLKSEVCSLILIFNIFVISETVN